MEPCYLMARKVTTIWWSLLVGGVVYVTLQPIIGMKWQLPLPQVLYPFNYNYVAKKNLEDYIHGSKVTNLCLQNRITFILTYMGQCLGQLVVGYVFTNFENLLVSTAILVCGQLDILYCSLKNIRYTAILLQENLNSNMFKSVTNS